MNPFTRFLTNRLGQQSIAEFAKHWDILERLVVTTFKAKGPTAADRKAYVTSRAWLLKHYPNWQAQLTPYWQGKLIGGKPAEADPFLRLLDPETADGFVDDWVAMQTLPAAREALNEYIVAKS